MEDEHDVQLAYDQHSGWVPMTPTAPRVEYPLGRLAGREAKRYSNHFDKHSKLASEAKEKTPRFFEVERLGDWATAWYRKLLACIRSQVDSKGPIVDDSVTVMTSSRTISTNVWEVQSNNWSDPRYDDHDMWDLVSVVDEEGRGKEDIYEHCEDDQHPCYALKHLHPSVASTR